MKTYTLVHALRSEGVVDAVIEAALVKAELLDIESAIRLRVAKAVALSREVDNPFEGIGAWAPDTRKVKVRGVL